jgi:hypothetical protein
MYDSNPAALFTYVAQQLNRFDLAYLHIVEPLRKVFKGTIRWVLESAREAFDQALERLVELAARAWMGVPHITFHTDREQAASRLRRAWLPIS